MKKRILCFLLMLILPCSLIFAGCSKDKKSEPEEEWIAVQSISYVLNEDVKEITSHIEFEIETETITKAEYDASTDLKLVNHEPAILEETEIKPDRTKFLNNLKDKKGFTWVHVSTDSGEFYTKNVITDYKINYVEILIVSDNVIKIKHKGVTASVISSGFEIVYFND
ncbi:MAG: hypothetical protein IKD36_02745 [Clostridia bacterium]|nr:hypothetical protein [Clostridia bacterium]